MEITVLQISLIFMVSCIVGIGSILDEFQFHRPLIACTLIGLVLGDIKTGVTIGGTLEMVSLGWMNVGASISPDTALSSIISTILVICTNQNIGSSIAIAIPVSAAGQILTVFVRTISIAFQHIADKLAKKGNLTLLTWIHIFALLLQAMRIAIPSTLVAISVGAESVQRLLYSIPKIVSNGLSIAGGMVVIVGYAMVINMMKTKDLMPFFYLGFVTVAFTNINLVALGIIGTSMAILYIQLNPKHYNQTVQNISKKETNTHPKRDVDNELN